jgi:hypothetical protein
MMATMNKAQSECMVNAFQNVSKIHSTSLQQTSGPLESDEQSRSQMLRKGGCGRCQGSHCWRSWRERMQQHTSITYWIVLAHHQKSCDKSQVLWFSQFGV